MRMIDADALIGEMHNIILEDGEDRRIFYEVIERQPTIEPKTGEWTPIHKGERGFSAGDFRCSVCYQPNKCYTMTNYCSHCGAYMKPTEKNDQ